MVENKTKTQQTLKDQLPQEKIKRSKPEAFAAKASTLSCIQYIPHPSVAFLLSSQGLVGVVKYFH